MLMRFFTSLSCMNFEELAVLCFLFMGFAIQKVTSSSVNLFTLTSGTEECMSCFFLHLSKRLWLLPPYSWEGKFGEFSFTL